MTKIKRFFLIFSPTELTCIVFISFLDALILASGHFYGNLGLSFAVNLVIILFVISFGLISNANPDIKILYHIRNWYPIAIILILYRELAFLIPEVNPHDIDPILIKLDYLIFGVHPTVWMEKIINPILTEISQLLYSTYYFLPIILGIVVYFDEDKRNFHHVFFGIIFAFYLSYMGYIIFPAVGPRFSLHHLQTNMIVGLFLTLPLRDILNGLELVMRDAFPSGHTMVTLVILYYAWFYARRVFYIYLPITAIIIFSTVYLRYHYVVDIIFGAILFPPIVIVVDYLMKHWEEAKGEVSHVVRK